MKNKVKDKDLAEWVKRWQRTGEELEKIRRTSIKNSKIAESIFNLSDASEAALLQNTPSPTSGLIEMQKWFKLLRKANDTDC